MPGSADANLLAGCMRALHDLRASATACVELAPHGKDPGLAYACVLVADVLEGSKRLNPGGSVTLGEVERELTSLFRVATPLAELFRRYATEEGPLGRASRRLTADLAVVQVAIRAAKRARGGSTEPPEAPEHDD